MVFCPANKNLFSSWCVSSALDLYRSSGGESMMDMPPSHFTLWQCLCSLVWWWNIIEICEFNAQVLGLLQDILSELITDKYDKNVALCLHINLDTRTVVYNTLQRAVWLILSSQCLRIWGAALCLGLLESASEADCSSLPSAPVAAASYWWRPGTDKIVACMWLPRLWQAVPPQAASAASPDAEAWPHTDTLPWSAESLDETRWHE